MNKRAFTLLETLFTLMVVSSLFVLTLSKEVKLDLSWINFSNEYLIKQKDSIINKEENEINDFTYVHFNKAGRVNQAQTINFNNRKVIVHLGNGYLTYE